MLQATRATASLVLSAIVLGGCTTTTTIEDTGDTARDYSDPADPEPATYAWIGNVSVTPGESLDGTESLVFLAEDETVLCQVDATLAMVSALKTCASCSWAFEVEITSASRSVTTYCDAFRIGEDHGVGDRFGMGLTQGKTDTLYSGNDTTLAPVEGATVTWTANESGDPKSAGTLDYLWPAGSTEYIPEPGDE